MTFATRNITSLRAGLALAHVTLTGVTLVTLFTVDIPEGNSQLLNLMICSLISNCSLVVGYYFGNQTRRGGSDGS